MDYGRVAIGNRQIQLIPPLGEKTRHTSEMLIRHMDAVGIDKAVLLQGPFYGECNQFASQAIKEYPERLIGVAYLDPWNAQSRRVLQRIVRMQEFVGVKVEFSFATGFCGIYPGITLQDPQLDWFWKQIEANGMVLVIDMGAIGSPSYQTHALRQVATRHPELTIIIAHLAQPTPALGSDKAASAAWREQVTLGLLPNVYFDTASVPAYVANEGYPFPTCGTYVREVVDQIGSSKLMWGTDIPATLGIATYKQLLDAAKLHLSRLGDSACSEILGQNAARVFRRRKKA